MKNTRKLRLIALSSLLLSVASLAIYRMAFAIPSPFVAEILSNN
jgi:hypothetical protein